MIQACYARHQLSWQNEWQVYLQKCKQLFGIKLNDYSKIQPDCDSANKKTGFAKMRNRFQPAKT